MSLLTVFLLLALLALACDIFKLLSDAQGSSQELEGSDHDDR